MSILRILFGWGGRIDRPTFFGVSSLVLGPYAVVFGLGLDMASGLNARWRLASLAAGVLSTWVGIALAAKRLRDAGRAPFWALAPAAIALASLGVSVGDLATADGLETALGDMSGLSFAGTAAGLLGLYLMFAGSNPQAEGERLRPFASARPREDKAPALGMEAALQRALAERAAPPAAPSLRGSAPQPPLNRAAGFGRRR